MTDPEKTVDQESYDTVEDRVRDFDFDRALKLMQIIEKVTTVSPKNTAFIGLAQAELERMHTEAKDIAVARAEAAKQAEAERAEAEAIEREKAERQRAQAEREKRDAADVQARSIPRTEFTDKDDPKPQTPSRTDEVAKNNMRRA